MHVTGLPELNGLLQAVSNLDIIALLLLNLVEDILKLVLGNFDIYLLHHNRMVLSLVDSSRLLLIYQVNWSFEVVFAVGEVATSPIFAHPHLAEVFAQDGLYVHPRFLSRLVICVVWLLLMLMLLLLLHGLVLHHLSLHR